MSDNFTSAFPRDVVLAQLKAVEAKAAETLWVGAPLLKGLAAMLRAEPDPVHDNWQRFADGTLKPFLAPERYDELRDDDRFLYNRGPRPAGLVEKLQPVPGVYSAQQGYDPVRAQFESECG